MTTSDHTLMLGDPGELLETVPYLLGFHPQDSLVIVGLDRQHVVVSARMDLADVSVDIEVGIPDSGRESVLAGALMALLRAQATMAIVIVYAPAGHGSVRALSPDSPLPNQAIVERVRELIGGIDVLVAESLLVAEGHWWSYPGRLSGCPACAEGTRLPGDNACAPAAAVFAGLQAHPNRAALAAVLDPDDDDQRDRRRSGIEMVERAMIRAGGAERLRDQRSVKRALFAAARDADRSLIARQAIAPSERSLQRFATGLRDIAVRDPLWLAIDQQRLDGRGLWHVLLQRLPAPYDSTPLFLFGWASWREGNGTLAAIAAERALASDNGYTAAELLLSAIRSGLDPFRTPRLRSPTRGGSDG